MKDRKSIGRDIRHLLFTPDSEARWTTNTASRLAPDLNRLTDEVLFGEVWSGKALPVKLRSLITVTALVVLDKPDQLRGHMMGALRVGWTAEELGEAVQQLAFYAGWPSAYKAIETLGECVVAFEAERAAAPL